MTNDQGTNHSNNHFSDLHFHFIGIGGIGMCGLAELMCKKNAIVTGSDLGESDQVNRLRDLGAKVFIGHNLSNVEGADVVVFSSAIKNTNVEIIEAKKKQIPIISRAEALTELMRLKRGIAIAGTHGKTTTSSLLASIFLSAGRDPTAVIGGKLHQLKSTAVLGKGDWFIAEADESDGSFLKLLPEVVVITNVDNDHLDYYGSFEKIKSAFYQFAEKIPFYGKVLVCGDDEHAYQLFQNFPKKVKFYGFDKRNDYRLKKEVGVNDVMSFCFMNKEIGKVLVPMPGDHNKLNAAAALAVACELGLDWSSSVKGIEGFSGVGRRAEHKGRWGEIDVYDDYAHHPTEVLAVLKGFKERFFDRRLVVLFQPHRYSRSKDCWQEFLKSFILADKLLISNIYPAGEKPVEGVTSERMVEEINHQDKKYIDAITPEDRTEVVSKTLQSGDVFITLGAGDGWRVGEGLLELPVESSS